MNLFFPQCWLSSSLCLYIVLPRTPVCSTTNPLEDSGLIFGEFLQYMLCISLCVFVSVPFVKTDGFIGAPFFVLLFLC